MADYPIASHRYLADPGSLVFEGRLYLYNSNDDDNPVAGGYEMKSIVCVSSSDLKNWTDHGEVLRVPANAKWAGYSWAPAAIERGGKIFLYYGNNANGIGVASSANPIGPFTDPKGSALVDQNTPGASGTNMWLFDPSIFVDADGQAYLTFGGNGDNNARIIKLNSDMISVSGSAIALTMKDFFEASWLFKRNDLYYYSYSNNSAAGLFIAYATSTSPTSGYTYRGVIGRQPPSNGNNNHHSDFVFQGNWYHAYHNRSVSTAAGISTTYKRNLGLEQLSFADDGTINEVKYTADGVPQLGHLNPYERVEAETTNAQSGIETETCGEGGMDVTSIDNGDFVKLRGVDFGTGAKSFSARVASASSGGKIELHLNDAAGTLIGTCAVASTGGAQKWSDVTCDVTGASGVKDLVLKFTGTGSQLFNVNYWQFTSIDGSNGGTGGAGGVGGTGGTSSASGAGGNAAGAGGALGTSGGGSGASAGGAPNGASGSSAAAGKASGGTATAGGGGVPSAAGTAAMPAAGTNSAASDAQDNAGCGCLMGRRSSTPFSAAALAFLAALWVRRARRSSSSAR